MVKDTALIPDGFTLLGQSVRVVWNPDLWRTEQALGKSLFNENTIVLDGNMQKDKAEHTFWHEVVHFILFYMSQQELTENEEFVDLFGGILHQVINTMEYK